VPAAAAWCRLVIFDGDGNVVASAEADYPPIVAANESSFGAFPLEPGSANAGRLISLSAGTYTAQAQSDQGGVVLLELYQLQSSGVVVIAEPIDFIPATSN
jgi:hypothetical protein